MPTPFPHDPLLDGPSEPRDPIPEPDADDVRDAREELARLDREWDDATRSAILYDRCHIEHLHNPRG